tara:strand:+ start:39 stop:311 length:273 start_codon:yes stop_codon:yes gene_type:complete
MAGIFGVAVRGLGMLGKKLGKKKINKGEGAIKSVKPGKNLAKKRKQQDEGIKSRDKIMSDFKLKPESRVNVRTQGNQPKINKKMSDIIDR